MIEVAMVLAVKIRTNTAKFTNMIIARFRESRYLVRESEVFIKDIRNSSGDEIANVNFLYDDIVHVLLNTIDSCINSATDRRGYVLERMCLLNSVK